MKAATSATVEATTASTTTVETTATSATTVEATATSATAVTATTALRKCSGRAKQRQRSEYREDNLETSGPIHVCNLHPTTSPTVRAARSPKPFYTN
jgi:hypothetical protein